MGSLGRAKRAFEVRVWKYVLSRKTLGLKGLMDTWPLNNLCGIGVNMFGDHKRPSGPTVRSRVWSLSTKDVLDLIREGKGIKERIFSWKFNAKIVMRLLANGKQRARIDLWVRAWNISRSHPQNCFKFGGLLEDTPTHLWERDRILWMAESWEKWCPRWLMEARHRKEGKVRGILFENDHLRKDHCLILRGRWSQDEIYDLKELHPIKEASRQLCMAIRVWEQLPKEFILQFAIIDGLSRCVK